MFTARRAASRSQFADKSAASIAIPLRRCAAELSVSAPAAMAMGIRRIRVKATTR